MSSSNIVSGSWQEERKFSDFVLVGVAKKRRSVPIFKCNTYVRNRVELGNLANFSGDEAKLFEVYLK